MTNTNGEGVAVDSEFPILPAAAPQGDLISREAAMRKKLSDLDRIDEYCEQATAGWSSPATLVPWPDNAADVGCIIDDEGNTVFVHSNWKRIASNINFAVRARTDLPRLSAALREMMGENERLSRELAMSIDRQRVLALELTLSRARVTELESALRPFATRPGLYIYHGDSPLVECQFCGRRDDTADTVVHTNDCLIAEARAALAATEKE